MARWFITLGALCGASAVSLGAFGAHALKARLPEYQLAIYHTGVEYQFYHALGLLLIGLLQHQRPARSQVLAGWFMFVGIVFFSGSLYVMSLTGIRWLGAITPVGGISFVIAWIMLAWAGLGHSEKNQDY